MDNIKGFKQILEESLRDVVPSDKMNLLPSGFQRIGDIVILNIHPEIEKYSALIADAVLKNYKYVKGVYRKTGAIGGEMREPEVEFLAGENKKVTRHRENGCTFMLDVTRIMFSKGNVLERGRLPPIIKDNEVVVDLFAGIGYFSIPIAVHSTAKRIYSIEINPNSIVFLRENIRINKVAHKVVPVFGDNRKVQMGNVADRVIMGYFPKTYEFLPVAFSSLKPEGGIIHYHDLFEENDLWDKPMHYLETLGFRYGYQLSKVLYKNVVKQYAPGVFHAVIDAEFRAA